MMKLLFVSTLLLPLLFYSSLAQEVVDDDVCNLSTAKELNLTDGATSSFSSVRLGWVGSSDEDCGSTVLAPATVYWHVYSLPDNGTDNMPMMMIAMSPPNLVTPIVKNGQLQFTLRDLRQDGYTLNNAAPVQAGVAVWLPALQMQSLVIAGVDETVEIVYNGTTTTTTTQPLTVKNSGVDNQVFITSPNAPVHYTASGVDTAAEIRADGVGGSSISLTGVDGSVSIVVPENDDTLTARLTGVDTKIIIQGGYKTIQLSGVAPKAYVSTHCTAVAESGIDAKCRVTNPVVQVTELDCLATTHITEHHFNLNWFLDNWGAIVGVVAAILGVMTCIGILCVFGCITCCCVCAQNNKKNKKQQQDLDNYEKRAIALEGGGSPEQQPAVAYAQAVNPGDVVDPHLVTAKTGTEQKVMDGAGMYS